jgi:methylthioribulose-1-phosphate dehydratase
VEQASAKSTSKRKGKKKKKGTFANVHSSDLIYLAPSGVQKELIKPSDIFVFDFLRKEYIRRPPALKPSACTPLFLASFTKRRAGCCIHTHSQWAVLVTLVVEHPAYERSDVFEISHIEQIKGIGKGIDKEGNLGYFDTLRVPIIENTARYVWFSDGDDGRV